jgi:hypothetical protein
MPIAPRATAIQRSQSRLAERGSPHHRSVAALLALSLAAILALAGCAAAASPSPSGTGYREFRSAAEAYLAMDRARVAAIGEAQLGGARERAVELAAQAVPEYEQQLAGLEAMPPLDCYREAHAATIAAVRATLEQVRGWAAGNLPGAEAEGFYLRYELKPQWKHTLDSEAVGCGEG